MSKRLTIGAWQYLIMLERRLANFGILLLILTLIIVIPEHHR